MDHTNFSLVNLSLLQRACNTTLTVNQYLLDKKMESSSSGI
eukprot:CAMPEP_0116872274 /NCGR_PEP_ID=MMETSP0463-20121206/2989_1 /TAXON_ID=181622 /ORGANISM="Strombidinopsis sp, Strain SopsisLIS2011" /LENGTH=40 /DNA_ID= /DNA_START= /DNA_END= /DNA_ORIENTATION=